MSAILSTAAGYRASAAQRRDISLPCASMLTTSKVSLMTLKLFSFQSFIRDLSVRMIPSLIALRAVGFSSIHVFSSCSASYFAFHAVYPNPVMTSDGTAPDICASASAKVISSVGSMYAAGVELDALVVLAGRAGGAGEVVLDGG